MKRLNVRLVFKKPLRKKRTVFVTHDLILATGTVVTINQELSFAVPEKVFFEIDCHYYSCDPARSMRVQSRMEHRLNKPSSTFDLVARYDPR
jgi:hypothetical protein